MATLTDEQRTRAWLDSLPYEDRPRAEFILDTPPGLALAMIDRDLRAEMRTFREEFRRPPLNKRMTAMFAVIGGAAAHVLMLALPEPFASIFRSQ